MLFKLLNGSYVDPADIAVVRPVYPFKYAYPSLHSYEIVFKSGQIERAFHSDKDVLSEERDRLIAAANRKDELKAPLTPPLAEKE